MPAHFVIYDDDDSLTLLHGQYPEYSRRDLSRYGKMISRAKDYGSSGRVMQYVSGQFGSGSARYVRVV